MLVSIFSAIPFWVWPLLISLIWVGTRASHDRDVSPLIVYALPLLGLLTLSRALSLGAAETALAALCLAYILGAFLGFRAQPRWIISKTAKRVHLRGEWITFTTIMVLFLGNFLTGMLQGMAPAISETTAFAIGFGALGGLFAGTLAGRAIRVGLTPIA